VAIAPCVPARPTPFGFFFGFFGCDIFAEFLFFGVPAAAFFAFVVAFIDRVRFVLDLVGFFVVSFGFVVADAGDDGRRGRRGQAGVGGGGCRKQQQRGEQEDQQDRKFAHSPFIGARRSSA
jgi:hypothetical protein